MAVLGSGLVGAAVVAAVLEDGRRVRVWGSTPSWYLSAFSDAGASVAATPPDAVAGAEVVVLAPTDDDERAAIETQLIDRIPPTGDPVRDDAGLALHTRALDTVIAARCHAGSCGTELEQAARAIDTLVDRENPRSPLARIAAGLRWSDDSALADRRARPA